MPLDWDRVVKKCISYSGMSSFRLTRPTERARDLKKIASTVLGRPVFLEKIVIGFMFTKCHVFYPAATVASER